MEFLPVFSGTHAQSAAFAYVSNFKPNDKKGVKHNEESRSLHSDCSLAG